MFTGRVETRSAFDKVSIDKTIILDAARAKFRKFAWLDFVIDDLLRSRRMILSRENIQEMFF